MTTTVARFQSDDSERVRNLTRRSIYLSLAGMTASAGIMVGELPDFPSLSMTQQRPAFVLVHYPALEGELESTPETKAGPFSITYDHHPYEFGRSQSFSPSRTVEPRRGQRISLRDARQIALQTLAETERRLEEERAAEARFLLSSWEDENSSA